MNKPSSLNCVAVADLFFHSSDLELARHSLFFIGVQLLYSIVLAPTIQQSESAGRVLTSLLFTEHGEEFPELDK